MTAAEHLDQCRALALQRVAAGELAAAYGELVCALQVHAGTAGLVTEELLVELAGAVQAGDGVGFCRLVDALHVASAGEHFVWSREQALARTEAGDAHGAMQCLVANLARHPGTTELLSEGDVSRLMHALVFGGPDGVRKFVEDLPGPPARGVAQVPYGEGRHRAACADRPPLEGGAGG